jgi:hypothetical protein
MVPAVETEDKEEVRLWKNNIPDLSMLSLICH